MIVVGGCQPSAFREPPASRSALVLAGSGLSLLRRFQHGESTTWSYGRCKSFGRHCRERLSVQRALQPGVSARCHCGWDRTALTVRSIWDVFPRPSRGVGPVRWSAGPVRWSAGHHRPRMIVDVRPPRMRSGAVSGGRTGAMMTCTSQPRATRRTLSCARPSERSQCSPGRRHGRLRQPPTSEGRLLSDRPTG